MNELVRVALYLALLIAVGWVLITVARWAAEERAKPDPLEELETQHAALSALSAADIDWFRAAGLDVPAELQRLRAAARDQFSMGVHAKLISNPEWEAWARELAPHSLPPAMELHGDGPVRRELVRRGYIEKPDGSYHPGPVELEPSPAGGWQPRRNPPPNPGVRRLQ